MQSTSTEAETPNDVLNQVLCPMDEPDQTVTPWRTSMIWCPEKFSFSSIGDTLTVLILLPTSTHGPPESGSWRRNGHHTTEAHNPLVNKLQWSLRVEVWCWGHLEALDCRTSVAFPHLPVVHCPQAASARKPLEAWTILERQRQEQVWLFWRTQRQTPSWG